MIYWSKEATELDDPQFHFIPWFLLYLELLVKLINLGHTANDQRKTVMELQVTRKM